MDEHQLRLDLYKTFTASLDTALMENQKGFDQAILTLSSGSIGALLAFAQGKNFHKVYFFAAVLPFLLAIVLTLLSFLLAQTLIRQKSENANKYYLQYDETAVAKEFFLEKFIKGMHWFAAIAFVLSIVMSIVFIINSQTLK